MLFVLLYDELVNGILKKLKGELEALEKLTGEGKMSLDLLQLVIDSL